MDNEKKLQMLMELDSKTDWQALIMKKETAKSKVQAVPQKPTRRLTKAEKKRQKMEKQLDQVKETMKMKNVQTIVYNNPDSISAKSRRAAAASSKKEEQATGEIPPEQEEQFDMRKARHEIMKFGMSSLKSKDLEDAEASLAMSLGAKPAKKPAVNYKELQVQRKTERELTKEMEDSLNKPNLKDMIKRKPQQGKGKMGSSKQQKDGKGRPGNKKFDNNKRKFNKQPSKPKRSSRS